MVKYCGNIGFAETAETSPGVWEETLWNERNHQTEVILFEQSEALMKINTPLSDIRDKTGDYICLEVVDLDKEEK